MSTDMDGFMGAVMALEGIEDMTVLLHGPDGCRTLLSAISRKAFPRPWDSVKPGTPYYGGISRVPCTGITASDYIYGAYNKLLDALVFLRGRDAKTIAVVNSPGADLIGDDCIGAVRDAEMTNRAFVLERCLMSETLDRGMDIGTLDLLRFMIPDRREHVKGTVNLLGVNILMKDWRAVTEEAEHILSLMGLRTVCCLNAGCTLEDIRMSATAEVNIVICPEFVRDVVGFYEDVHGIPQVGLGHAPIGFDCCRNLIIKITEKTGANPSKALDYVDRTAHRALMSMTASDRVSVGRTFSVDACPSMALPLVKTLHRDLAMVPVHVGFRGMHEETCERELESYLEENGLILNEDEPDVMLSDGNTAVREQYSGHCRSSVDLGYPSATCSNFRRSPVIGPSGMLYILDRTMNPLQD